MDNISATNTSNNTVSSSSWSPPSKAEGIAVCSVFAMEALVIVVGNLLTIVFFALKKTLRRKKSLFLVINMAIADCILGALFLPLHIYIDWGVAYSLWTLSVQWSFYLNFFYNITVTVFLQGSLLSAAMMSVERFYAIYWPLKHQTSSGRLYRVVIFILWTFSTTFTIICGVLVVLTASKNANYCFSSLFLILLIIVCCCNIGIWRKFQHRVVASRQQNRALQNNRLTKTLLFVSISALLSWLPSIIIIYLDATAFSRIYFVIVFVLYSNSFVNPIVYALRIPEFRQALRLCCFRRQLAIDLKQNERSNNRAAALKPDFKQGTLSTDKDTYSLPSAKRTLSTPVELGIYEETSL